MKTKYYLVAIALMFVMSCSKNEEVIVSTDTTGTVESFDPIEIKFVYEDGTDVASSACISADQSYAVQIKTSKNSNGNTKVSKVEYTINGALYSMTFSEAGTKSNPIVLVDGRNIAELASTGNSSEVTYVGQGGFELVN